MWKSVEYETLVCPTPEPMPTPLLFVIVVLITETSSPVLLSPALRLAVLPVSRSAKRVIVPPFISESIPPPVPAELPENVEREIVSVGSETLMAA